MNLGQKVWVWRMASMERWALTKATVQKRHRNGEITVDFGNPTGLWSNRGGTSGGYELTEHGRYPRSGVYEVKGDAVTELPVAYKAIRNRLT